MFICIGILLALVAGLPYQYGVHSVSLLGASVEWWRIMLGFALLPAVGQVCSQGLETAQRTHALVARAVSAGKPQKVLPPPCDVLCINRQALLTAFAGCKEDGSPELQPRKPALAAVDWTC